MKTKEFHIGVGSHNRKPSAGNPLKYYDVKTIQVHQLWAKNDKLEDDLALLTLRRSISVKLKVARINLPRSALDYPARGQAVMAIGWGVTSNNVYGPSPQHLQGALVRILPLRECERIDQTTMPNTKICIDASKRSVCSVRKPN